MLNINELYQIINDTAKEAVKIAQFYINLDNAVKSFNKTTEEDRAKVLPPRSIIDIKPIITICNEILDLLKNEKIKEEEAE